MTASEGRGDEHQAVEPAEGGGVDLDSERAGSSSDSPTLPAEGRPADGDATHTQHVGHGEASAG